MSTNPAGAQTQALPQPTQAQRNIHDAIVALSMLLPTAGLVFLFWVFAVTYRDYPLLVAAGIGVFVAGNWIHMNGISIAFHRKGTHGAIEMVYWLDFIFTASGCFTLQGKPLKWIIDHWIHHDEADREGDPHSPHDKRWPSVIRRFLHGHCLWFYYLFNPQHRPSKEAAKRKQLEMMLRQDPTKRAIVYFSRTGPYLSCIAISFIVPTLIVGTVAWWAYGAQLFWTGCLVGFLSGGLASKFWSNHSTYCVNSVCHLWGYRNLVNRLDKSVNNWWVALLTHGEGFHGNHHDDPTAPNHGWKLLERVCDHSYHVLSVLKILKLADCTFRTEADLPAIQRMLDIQAKAKGLSPT